MKNETLYEANYHHLGYTFSHCTVSPITVVRRGILPGCSAESITAIGKDGRRFNGSPKDYFFSEKEAWEGIKKEISESILSLDEQIKNLNKEIAAQKSFLETIQDK